MTLIEVLVVLALIGTVLGAAGLSLGGAGRGQEARRQADLLAARMRRASDEAVIGGAAVAFVWEERAYRFLSLSDGAWAPHPLPLLGTARTLDAGVRFGGEGLRGAFAVTAASLPAEGPALALALGTGEAGRAVLVTWDGATATVTGAGP